MFHIYDISSLRVKYLTLILQTWIKWNPNNVSKWQMGFNSAFKGLKAQHVSNGIPLIVRSSKLYLHPLVYMYTCGDRPFPTQTWQRPVTTYLCKPEAANTVWSFWWWAVCRSNYVEFSINVGIINSITRLHLVAYFYWFMLRCMDPWIPNLEIQKNTKKTSLI